MTVILSSRDGISWSIKYFDTVPNINYIVHAFDKRNPFYKDADNQFVKHFRTPMRTFKQGEFVSKYWAVDCNVFMAIKSNTVRKSGGD